MKGVINMYQHLLLIYSDYSKGRRIAFYRSYNSIEEIMEFVDITDRIKATFNHLTFSFHHIQTESEDIYSIESYDPYFREIEYISDLEEYMSLIKSDIEIEPMDIAKIILSKKSLCQLALEKIMYFVDCEYLKKLILLGIYNIDLLSTRLFLLRVLKSIIFFTYFIII